MVKKYTLKVSILLISGVLVLGIMLWRGSGQRPKAVLDCQGYVSRIAFSPDGKILAVGCHWDHVVELWEVSAGKKIATLPVPPVFGSCSSVAFSPDGNYLAAGGSQMIKYWDVSTLKEKSQDQWHKLHVTALHFTPDSKMLASASLDGTLKLWEVETREEKALLKSQADCLSSLAFSPDGKVLAAGGNRGRLIFWDTTKQAEITSVHCGDQDVYALAFSADGKILASASSDGYVMLWELATKQTKRTLRWHDGSDMENYLASNGSAAFSPDLKVFASCGGPGEGPGEIWLRDMVTGNYITTLKGHSGAVSSVAFSPDGNVLASGGWDKKVRLWDLPGILKDGK